MFKLHPLIRSWSLYSFVRNYKTNSRYDAFFGYFYNKLLGDGTCGGVPLTNVSRYQHAVLDLLREGKGRAHDLDLEELQMDIERLARPYDDFKNMYQASPDIVKILIRDDARSAKDYLKGRGKLTTYELEMINGFHQYTLEVIIIHILGSVFNCIAESPAVRVATLVDQLDSVSRTHARLLYERKAMAGGGVAGVREPDDAKNKNIGCLLVEFLLDRDLITVSNDLSLDAPPVDKNKGKYYTQKSSYVICNFDLSLLPIQLNLPMVYPPKGWDVVPRLKKSGEAPQSLSDLTGGYLSDPVGDFYLYNRYNLLTSRDTNNFYILLGEKYQEMCDTMNALQEESFEINVDVLDFIKNNENDLVRSGLLMPRFLASLNITAATNLLRKTYLGDEKVRGVKSCVKYPDLLREFLLRIQRARYETFIIDLASAYAGYEFYLPAFVDFRGRIYRAGVLHFHERDLARSLIVFSRRYSDMTYTSIGDPVSQGERVRDMLYAAAAFHYQKFQTYGDASKWYIRQCRVLDSEVIIKKYAAKARDPFQFLSKVICLEGIRKISLFQMPITQDASASAYQIISYYLLDFDMAINTNLIPDSIGGGSPVINDVYDFFVSEILNYIMDKNISSILENKEVKDIVCNKLDRKLVKSLLMPLVYGKTAYSMADDIYQHYNQVLGKKESMGLASLIDQFFKEKFPRIVNLISLIRTVGWIASAMGRPVYYSTPVFTTVQDYMKSEAVNIWIYDRPSRKRRKVTLRIPTKDRDRRKTTAAMFANFIHQKDANIAFYMIHDVKKLGIPIYTVHDNFITTPCYAPYMACFYLDIFIRGPGPLEYVNALILQNLKGGKEYNTGYFKNRAFTEDEFNSLLGDLEIPELYKNKKRYIWDKRLKDLTKAYNDYIQSIRYPVSGPNPRSINGSNDDRGYISRYEKYKNKLEEWSRHTPKYCLHL